MQITPKCHLEEDPSTLRISFHRYTLTRYIWRVVGLLQDDIWVYSGPLVFLKNKQTQQRYA